MTLDLIVRETNTLSKLGSHHVLKAEGGGYQGKDSFDLSLFLLYFL